MRIRKEVKKILSLDSLGPGEKSRLIDCETLDLSDVLFVGITTRCTFPPGFTGYLTISVLGGVDTMMFDTTAYWEKNFVMTPGQEVQTTDEIVQFSVAIPKYLKVQLTNTDTTYPVTDIDVWATLVHFE
jgi:small basic protein